MVDPPTTGNVYVDMLAQGRLIEAAYYLFIDYTGDLGIILFFFTVFSVLWLMSENMVIPTVVAILLGGLIFVIAPAYLQYPAYVLVAFGLSGVIYRLFKK